MGARGLVERPLTPELSLVDILDDLLWHRDGRLSLCYRLEALHEPGLSDDDFRRHALLARNVFGGVPEETSWQFFVLVDHEDGVEQLRRAFPPITDASPTGKLFEEFRQAKLRELTRPDGGALAANLLQSRRHYLVVSFRPRTLRISFWKDWALRVRSILAAGEANVRNWGKYAAAKAEAVAEASQLDRAVSYALLNMGLGFRRCGDSEMVSFYYELLNPTASRAVEVDSLSCRARMERDGLPRSIVEELPWASDPSPVWSLLGDEVFVRRELLEVGEYCMGLISLHELPDKTSPGMLVPLLHLARARYVLAYRIDVPNQAKEVAALRFRGQAAEGIRFQNFLVESSRTDKATEAVQRQADEAVERVISSTERICGASLQLAVYEKTPRALSEAVQEVLGLMSRAHGIRGLREGYMLWPAYLSFLPGAPMLVERRRKVPTANVVDMLPFFDFRTGDGKVPFLNSKNSYVLYDPWAPHLESPHVVITGRTGSGKSFLAQTIITSYEIACRARGEPAPYVFVLDNGESYRRLMELREDGRYVRFSLDDPPGVDVFAWKADEESLDEHVSRLEWLLLDLLRVSPRDEERFERMKQCIEEALYGMYRDGEGSRDFKAFAAALGSLAGAKLSDLEDLRGLLFAFSEGKFARLLLPNPRQELNPAVHAICYDFVDLKDHRDLALVSLRLAIYQVWRWASRMARRGCRTFLLVDESWFLMQSGSGTSMGDQGAPFLNQAARMGRKHGMCLVGISQSIADWSRSSYGRAVIDNSATFFIGRSAPGEAKALRDELNLTDRQQDTIARLGKTERWHEFLLLQGGASQDVRVLADPLSRWVFTTKDSDRTRLAELADARPDLSLLERIRHLAAEE